MLSSELAATIIVGVAPLGNGATLVGVCRNDKKGPLGGAETCMLLFIHSICGVKTWQATCGKPLFIIPPAPASFSFTGNSPYLVSCKSQYRFRKAARSCSLTSGFISSK